MHVALTGFMGAGKSTAGRRLARLLRMPFFDSDAEVERHHGSIVQIFAQDGEPAFRRYESAVLENLMRGSSAVIAVGGGAVLDERNRRRLREKGYIVHLAVSPQTVLRRVAHRRHRPLLGAQPDLVSIQAILAARESAYADHDFRVQVDDRTPLGVARTIARWYNDRVSGDAS